MIEKLGPKISLRIYKIISRAIVSKIDVKFSLIFRLFH